MKLTPEYLEGRGIDYTVTAEGNLTVGGGLDLSGTQITALPDNLTVGGWLNLRGTQITALPDNLTVGGGLDLEGTQITALPDNLTVGGWLNLRGTQITKPSNMRDLPEGFSASVRLAVEIRFNAKGFTIADGILARVIHAKGALKKIIVVGKKSTSWLACDGNGNYAHGETARLASEELSFKNGDRDTSHFKGMALDTIKTPQEWAFVYRMVTGACQQGTRSFMEQKARKASYSLAEIISETKGAYGHERFKEFFAQ